MPLAPLRPCPAVGCRQLTRGGRCEAHRRDRHRQFDATRGTATQRGYGTSWRRIRLAVLAAPSSSHRRPDGLVAGHGPLCVMCHVEHQRVQPATDVDHLDGNSANNDPENLRSLCHSCHSRRTAVDQGFARRA